MEDLKVTRKDIFQIPTSEIVVKEGFNCRNDFGDLEELARQIKEQGVLNPITVKKTQDGKYQLVDGERRFRAVNMLNKEQPDTILRIPSIVVPSNYTDGELLLQQIVRNEGKRFNEYEMGVACQKLMEIGGYTPSEIAKKLGKSNAQVSQWLGIVGIENDELREMVKTGVVSGGTIRNVLRGNSQDENKALKELKTAQKKAEEKGKTTVTLEDFSQKGNTLAYKNTATIKTAIAIINSYVKDFVEEKEEDGLKVIVDMNIIINAIKDGKMIDEAVEMLNVEPM